MAKNQSIIADVKKELKTFEKEREPIYFSDALSSLKAGNPKSERGNAEQQAARLGLMVLWTDMFNLFDKYRPEDFDKSKPFDLQVPDYIATDGRHLPPNTKPETIADLNERRAFTEHVRKYREHQELYTIVVQMDRVLPDLLTEFRWFVLSNYSFGEADQVELMGNLDRRIVSEKRKKQLINEFKKVFQKK